MNQLKPVCIDLDGTLIRNDVTAGAIKLYIKRSFLNIFKVVFWLFHGRSYLKRMLAVNVEIDAASLDYNHDFLNFVIDKKKEGHKIFLATASDIGYANKVADFLNIFDGVFASNGHINLRSEAKADALVAIFGEKGFIYAGNSKDDVKVWNRSAECILVTPTKAALKQMRRKKYLLFK